MTAVSEKDVFQVRIVIPLASDEVTPASSRTGIKYTSIGGFLDGGQKVCRHRVIKWGDNQPGCYLLRRHLYSNIGPLPFVLGSLEFCKLIGDLLVLWVGGQQCETVQHTLAVVPKFEPQSTKVKLG